MRKSFKKVLAAVLVASMAFSTPIVSDAGTGEGGAAQTVAVAAGDVNDVISTSKSTAYLGAFSDKYEATGDFDATFTLTNVTSDMAGNYNAPLVILNNAAGTKVAEYRADNWCNAGDADTTKSGQWEFDNATWMANGEWAGMQAICKDCTATINVKRTANKVYVTESFTNAENKTFAQKYIYHPTAAIGDKMSVQFSVDGCTATVSNVAVAADVYSVAADASLDLVTNDDAKKEATLTTVAKHNNVVDEDAEVTFASADEAVATVDATGKVTAVANGTTTITSTYQGETAETTVKVTTDPKSVVISGEGVADNALQLVVNKEKAPLTGVAPVPVALTATVNPDTTSNKKVVWTSDNEKVTVSETGVAQAAEDAANGTTAKITATVEGTSVKAELNVTVKVNEVAKLVAPGRIVIATPAAVTTVSAGDKVQMSATVYGGGEDSNIVAANQNVVWSAAVKRVVSGTAVTVSGAAVDVSATGEVTVPSNVEDNDVVAVTATSKVAPEVKATKEIRVRNGEVLTGTAWWNGMQVSKDRIIDADNTSVNFIVQPTEGDGFCVEIYSLDKKEDGTYAKHEKADAVSTEKGAYITFSYPGSFDGWMAGSNACKVNADGSDVSIGSDALYSISTDKVNGFNVADTYQVTVTKSGNDVLMLIKDLTTNAWFWRAIAKDVDMDSDILGVHFMAQFGTFTLYNVNEDGSAIETLTTNKTDKPVTVTPGKRPTAAPTATPDNSTKATATPTPNNNNNTNNTTVGKTTLKKATITVKKGKKKVSKVTVKKGKKVTLKVSANSKGKISMAKLSKKAKKVASVTLKSGKLTIKGKKKGKVTIKLTAKKTSKYKAATKSVKVTVK